MKKNEYTKQQIYSSTCNAGLPFIKRMFKKYSKNGETIIITQKVIRECLTSFTEYCEKYYSANVIELRFFGYNTNVQSFFSELTGIYYRLFSITSVSDNEKAKHIMEIINNRNNLIDK